MRHTPLAHSSSPGPRHEPDQTVVSVFAGDGELPGRELAVSLSLLCLAGFRFGCHL